VSWEKVLNLSGSRTGYQSLNCAMTMVGICCGFGCRFQMTGPCPPFLLRVTVVSKSVIVAGFLLQERVWSRRCHLEISFFGLAGPGDDGLNT